MIRFLSSRLTRAPPSSGTPYAKMAHSNEYWVNINNGRGQRDSVLRRVAARTRKCADAGFDAIEYDVVDAWPLSGADERSGPGAEARAQVRLCDQRAVLPVLGVHQQPLPRLPGLHPRQ